MQFIEMKCPACGGIIDQKITSRMVTCEYCGTRFALDGDNADDFIEQVSDFYDEEAQDANYGASDLSMPDYAAEVCADFLDDLDDDGSFQNRPKILRGLNIADGDNVLLIHDDTFMKSGKNGFAITERGLYCREMGGEATFHDWASFAKMEKPTLDSCYIKCGKHEVCYFTDDNDLLPYLYDLYLKLFIHARRTMAR